MENEIDQLIRQAASDCLMELRQLPDCGAVTRFILSDESVLRVRVSVVSEKMVSEPTTGCYAWRENSGVIDLDSISETPDGVRIKYLESCMGWRFQYPDRYDQNESWNQMLTYGAVVPVVVSEVGGSATRKGD